MGISLAVLSTWRKRKFPTASMENLSGLHTKISWIMVQLINTFHSLETNGEPVLFFPAISMWSPGSVTVNFGSKPFKYVIKDVFIV